MITEINKENFRTPELQSFLLEAMKIQKSHFADQNPDEANGFVVTQWSKEEWENLIVGGSRVFILRTMDEKVSAYIIVSPFSDLEDLLREASSEIDLDFGQFHKNEWKYLYQMSVAPGLTQSGLGTELCKTAMKRVGAKGYFADYMVSPWRNQASESFLKRNGFEECGRLTLNSYRNFSSTTWQIVSIKEPSRLSSYGALYEA